MCTYDYTPYAGCEDGPQHYFIQWVKCSIAVEKGSYCSLDASTKAEQLRKLSVNVLSCPLHGPIAVQQYVLDAANASTPDDEAERLRARSTTRRGATSRGRTPRRNPSDREDEQPVRQEVRRRRSRREVAHESSDSESPSAYTTRPRTADRVKRSVDRDMERPRTMAHNSHRRSTSADIPLPPLPTLSMRHGRSEVSLPLKTGLGIQAEDSQIATTVSRQTRPKTSLEIPRAPGVIGLPSSPDMHRRGSVHRSRSEGVLNPGNEGQSDLGLVPRSALSPSNDSSPDQNPELPFSSPGRRGRRAGARSIRDRSVDTTMRRIDEDVAPEQNHVNMRSTRGTPSPETQSSTATTSPEPQYPGASAPHPLMTTTSHIPHHRRSGSRPHLNTLQIPKNRDQYHQRDAYSAPTATPPDTDINPNRPPQKSRAKSLRHVDISPEAMMAAPSYRNEETASIHSTRSRRFEDQVAEGRKWVAAREHHMPVAAAGAAPTPPPSRVHMSEPELALAPAAMGAGRESVDSGYRSGHQPQRSWETVKSSSAADSVAAKSGGRNTLQKSPPPPTHHHHHHHHHQAESSPQGGRQRPTPPPPLNLGGGGGLPLCSLPVSLISPGFQSDADDVSPLGGKGGKLTLRQRMGLRKKISGLLWDRGGQREVGVEG
ncbi:hypothetical protein C8A00DRAFT_19545 [Chaetomidium leptoderma]|uniref:Uncharacterized protein n=1 Tax=Chaetomidium leptoderma TaxID=669021 RepID=A0AAN6VC38_9PEZI|nr:hypothetical protein C8A00DRAFT_19545 [Chaetomidium leptoderma]